MAGWYEDREPSPPRRGFRRPMAVGATLLSVLAGLLAAGPTTPSGASSCGSTPLTIGQSLGPGQCLAAGPATLTMQTTGNLVSTTTTPSTRQSTVVWASGTTGTGNELVLPTASPGQAQVQGATGVAIMTVGRPASGSLPEQLALEGDGNVLLQVQGSVRGQWQTVWQSGTPSAPFSLLLTATQSDWSPSGNFQLLMQNTGNLVLYYHTLLADQGLAIWSTGTTAHAGAYAVMQDNGNFVVYAATGEQALWASGTTGVPSPVLQVQDDGNVVVYGSNTAGQYAAWSTRTNGDHGSTLRAGQDLQAGQYLQSPTGTYRLLMAPAGVLVLYQTDPYACPLWSAPQVTGTASFAFTPQPGTYLALTTGKPGLHAPGAPGSGSSLWAAGAAGTAGATLTLQADGNLVLYDQGHTGAPWATGTNLMRGSVLCTGASLSQGQYLVPWQTNGAHNGTNGNHNVTPGPAPGRKLVLQDTCNLVFYGVDTTTPTWSSTTDVNQAGQGKNPLTKTKAANGTYDGCYLVMQSDGNLVMYGGHGTAMWASNTDQPATLPFGADALGPYLAAPVFIQTYFTDRPPVGSVLFVATSHGQLLGTPRPTTTTASAVLSDVLDGLSLFLTFVGGPVGAAASDLSNAVNVASVLGNWAAFGNDESAAKSAAVRPDTASPQPTGAPAITTCTVTSPATMEPGTYLDAGGCLSADGGTVKLVMQSDGNLVLYGYGGDPTGPFTEVLWASNTDAGRSLTWAYATVTAAGALTVATSTPAQQWTTGTTGQDPVLALGSDGDLRLWDGQPGASGSPVSWQTSTGTATVTACSPSTSPSVLLTGQTMASTSCLYSPGGQYRLIMQSDGNLVEYFSQQDTALWSSATDGHAGATASLDPSGGQLTVSRPGQTLWSSTGAAYSLLALQTTGNLVLYGSNGKVSVDAVPYAAWQSGTANRRGNRLAAGQVLMPGQYLESFNTQYRLTMGTTGLLELSYTTPVKPSYFCPLWTAQGRNLQSAGTDQPVTVLYHPTLVTASYLSMQDDGNLVLYRPTTGSALWATGSVTTTDGSADYLQLGTDGNLVVYGPSGQVRWSSGTDDDRGTALCTDGQLYPTQFITKFVPPHPDDNYVAPTPKDRLLMQGTCNLVLYDPYGAVWSSTTDVTQAGQGKNGLSKKHLSTYAGCHLVMQADGNLVMYGANGTAMWSSTTTRSGTAVPQLEKNLGPYSVVIQTTGTTERPELLQIRTAANEVVWSEPKVVLATPASENAAASGVQSVISTIALILGFLPIP